MSIQSFTAQNLISALVDLVDTSADRYARSFGPLLAERKARAAKPVRAISVFRAA